MSNSSTTVYFLCPSCEGPGKVSLSSEMTWTCPRCEHPLNLSAPQTTTSNEGTALSECVVCGSRDLYKKKGFPHWLGISLLAVACIAFLYFQGRYQQELAWAILLISAAIDGLLYALVPDVIVCYRCHSQYRGLGKSANEPFELVTFERYRQEKARQEQMKKG